MRVGVVVPHSNTVLENDLRTLLPLSIETHTQRWRIATRGDHLVDEIQRISSLNENLSSVLGLLPAEHLDLIVYGCTTGSFMSGVEGMKGLEKSITEATGLPTISVTRAIATTMRDWNLNNVAVFSPYTPKVNALMKNCFMQMGFRIAQAEQDPWFRDEIGRHAGSQPLSTALDFIKETVNPGVDGIVLSCSAWHVLPIRSELESSLGIPVVTANQAVATQINSFSR